MGESAAQSGPAAGKKLSYTVLPAFDLGVEAGKESARSCHGLLGYQLDVPSLNACLEIVFRPDVEPTAHLAWDGDLKFWRNDDGFHAVFLSSCATVAL